MATKDILFLICIFVSPFLSQAQQDGEQDINWWCSTTPHPETCKYFMAGGPDILNPRRKADFRTMTVKVALDRAIHAYRQVEQLENHCHSRRKKAVWNDCYKLLDNTIFQLNRTLYGLQNNMGCSDFDAQTWVSTALTNLQTCQLGSVQLNVSNFIYPLVSSNVSELISNSLAINGRLMKDQDHKDGFPSWVTVNERKLLRLASLPAAQTVVVVAKDGSGRFRSIQAAINDAVAKRKGNGRIVIYIKRGVYRENVQIGKNMNKIMLVGDGFRYTIITGSRSSKAGFTTYSSATVGIDGAGFIAKGITFQNTAGPQNGQAVALRTASDLSAFYACSVEGYQDTLFVHSQRQFYKACKIYGTVDFIFGNAAVVFQNCIIYARRPLNGQGNTITAQGRGDPFQNSGISIHNSVITAASDLRPVVNSVKTYLGRPWQQYSRTVFLRCYIDKMVSPEGWTPWGNSNFAQDTLYYGEYRNFGPGSSTNRRVKWLGFHIITSASEASQFTVSNLIAGRAWLPATRVPFTAGL